MKTKKLSRLQAASRWMDAHPIRTLALTALVLTFVVECLSHRSVLRAAVWMLTQPFPFLLGALIVFATLSLGLFAPKRHFAVFLLGMVWVALSVTDFVMRFYRVTPLAAIDFALVPSVFSIFNHYLRPWQIVLIAVLFVLFLVLLVLLGLRTKKRKPLPVQGVVSFVCAAALVVGFTALGHYAAVLPKRINNLADAYRDCGFVYCFTTSLYDRGISKPELYEDEITTLVDELETEPEPEPEPPVQVQLPAAEPTLPLQESMLTKPQVNVVFLQLESFIDPNEITRYTYSENPVPNFQRLKRTAGSGYLTVPSIGAGTANTEFEIISGMSLQFFGTGEYPYKTVLRDHTCETIAYNLMEHGYATTAIHNNKAAFYDRNEVFSHLGFQRFDSIEYMSDVRLNPQGWAEDEVLTGEIMTALQSTEERDFVYTISVQGHGSYPDVRLPEDTGTIEVYGAETELEENRIRYYVNQIAAMDSFIGDLTAALSEFEEPTVLVLYGDHLPSLELAAEDLKGGDLFCTEYVCWTNFGLRTDDKDLCAYQLGSYVMRLFGYYNGNLNRLHHTADRNSDYIRQLGVLEYDMLYGDQVVFGGENPYQPTKLDMGLEPVRITTVAFGEDKLYVFGEHFTPYSMVCTNGRQRETVYVDEKTLCVEGVSIEEVRTVIVQQVSEDSEVLSETHPYVLQ